MSEIDYCTDGYGSGDQGPLHIDYFYLYTCTFKGYEFFSCLLLLGWIVLLTNLLGNTAGNYFGPTLASICSKLKISYDVAGVTFLAFGNGSPDIFSSLSSFSGGSDGDSNSVLIGLGALLGGSMFVSTIVVGSICILSPCKLNPTKFLRDISFHIIAVSAVTYLACNKKVHIYVPCLLLLWYCIYVIGVVGGSGLISIFKRCALGKSSSIIIDTSEGELNTEMSDIIVGSQVQTAYWHNNTTNTIGVLGGNDYNSFISSTPIGGLSSDTDGYKFLILDDNMEGDNNEDIDEKGEVTINLSGGLISPSFNSEIINDYFGSNNDNYSSNNKDSYTSTNPISYINDSDQYDSFPTSSLEQSLLPPSDSPRGMKVNVSNSSSRYNHIIQAIYWQQQMLRRRVKYTLLSSNWCTLPWYSKVITMIEFPFNIARDFTIPTVEKEMWSKVHAVLQPQLALLFLLFLSSDIESYFGGFTLFIGFIPSFVVFLLTHNAKPPTGKVFMTIWILFAFVMCVAWIYMFANELVTCLLNVGNIFNVPSSFLGLTVLAWGNSIGDFFSNTSAAKQGFGEMAIAGCYAGPVFNILTGLSLSLFYACIQAYPEPFVVTLDVTSTVSIVFLYISLISTLVTVSSKGFELDKALGYYLIMLYIAYSVVQLSLLILGFDRGQ